MQRQEVLEALDAENDIEYKVSPNNDAILITKAGVYLFEGSSKSDDVYIYARPSCKNDEFGSKVKVESVDQMMNIIKTRQTRKQSGSTSSNTSTTSTSTESSNDSTEVTNEDDTEDDTEEPIAWSEEDEEDAEDLIKQQMDQLKTQQQALAKKLEQRKKAKSRPLRVSKANLEKVVKEEVSVAVTKILNRAKEYIE